MAVVVVSSRFLSLEGMDFMEVEDLQRRLDPETFHSLAQEVEEGIWDRIVRITEREAFRRKSE